MDDTTQQSAQPVQDMPAQMPQADAMVGQNLSDLAGMTPPPPAPVPPASDSSQMDVTAPQVAAPATGKQDLTQDDYSYAEDILDEILDSLDRIEAKVEAIEKKLG